MKNTTATDETITIHISTPEQWSEMCRDHELDSLTNLRVAYNDLMFIGLAADGQTELKNVLVGK